MTRSPRAPWCPTTSCLWPSARKGRTPASRRGCAAGRSTSRASRRWPSWRCWRPSGPSRRPRRRCGPAGPRRRPARPRCRRRPSSWSPRRWPRRRWRTRPTCPARPRFRSWTRRPSSSAPVPARQAAVQEEAEQLEPAALAEATVEDAADVPVAAEIPVLDDAAVELDADLGEADAVLEDELPEEFFVPKDDVEEELLEKPAAPKRR